MESKNITEQITTIVFELLEQNPDGLRWSELLSKVKESNPSFHPKTVNGTVWKLVQNYPDKVYKPEKGVFRLLKYKN